MEDVKGLRDRQRRLHAQLRESIKDRLPAESAYRVEDHKIAVEDGEITVRCLTPTTGDAEERFPLLIWFHGGGFVFGDLDMNDYHLRIMCVEHRLSIVNVDYRLAPEHVHPIPWEDAYAATKWVVRNGSLLSASFEKGFILGGASAGANLTVTVARRARDDIFFRETPITGQVLQAPPILHPEDPAEEKYRSELLSMEQNKDGPLLTREVALIMADVAKLPVSSPHHSLLLQPSHVGTPPVYMQVAGMDPLRDEGLLYAKLLEQADVATRVDVYPGVPHFFHYFFPQLTMSVKADKDMNNGIRWLLGLTDGRA
ncbi:AB hydrolase superfamily protein [Sparassis crispa]|uniref:AB hydrolase superfamily protein n=1 Tax=Sparassis crispa TaxID=139825 RepID=A0A401GL03_9APHY|nr:AB hydrolase superfamily protein [Sparassis crispa]GBE82847.1 AB hydrolase superfamily protein [Sparassis crispa]